MVWKSSEKERRSTDKKVLTRSSISIRDLCRQATRMTSFHTDSAQPKLRFPFPLIHRKEPRGKDQGSD